MWPTCGTHNNNNNNNSGFIVRFIVRRPYQGRPHWQRHRSKSTQARNLENRSQEGRVVFVSLVRLSHVSGCHMCYMCPTCVVPISHVHPHVRNIFHMRDKCEVLQTHVDITCFTCDPHMSPHVATCEAHVGSYLLTLRSHVK